MKKIPLLIGIIVFIATCAVTSFFESPSPSIAASFVVSFLIFEISYYHFFDKECNQHTFNADKKF